jgi:hypothetical protein
MSTSTEEKVRELIQHCKLYMECALGHPAMPVGEHKKLKDVDMQRLVPEVADMYAVVWRLYATNSDSEVFREPVNALLFGLFDYYKVIKEPMSLRTILDKAATSKYSNAGQVKADLDLIWANCERFNGSDSEITAKARKCAEWVRKTLVEMEDASPISQEAAEMFIERMGQNPEHLGSVTDIIEREQPTAIEDGEINVMVLRKSVFNKLTKILEPKTRSRTPVGGYGGKRGRMSDGELSGSKVPKHD